MSEPDETPKWLRIGTMFKEFATPKYFWLVFGLIVVGSTAAFGGMGEIPPAPVKPVSAPATIKAEPFEITVQSAYVTDIQPGYTKKYDNNRYLVFRGEAVTHNHAPVYGHVFANTFRIEATELRIGPHPRDWEKLSPTCMLAGSLAGDAQPDLPFPFVCFVAQTEQTATPAELKIHVRKHQFRRDSLIGRLGWRDATDVALVTVELKR